MQKSSSVISQYISWSGFILLCIILSVDIASAFIHPLGALGIILWCIIFLYLLLYGGWCVIQILRHTIRHSRVLSFLGISLIFMACVYNLTHIKSLSGETTQEIACTLSRMQHAVDYGFQQTCLFGYPTRQYIIPAISTILFGRNQLALNLGGMIYFTLGILIFSHGILTTIRDPFKADFLVLIALASLFHFRYIIHFLFLYEQSIFPMSFALMGCGIWMHYKRSFQPHLLVLLGILLLYSIFSYTPSLALIPLGCIVLLYIAYTNKSNENGIILWGLPFIIIGEYILSLHFRRDLHILLHYPGSYVGMLQDIVRGIIHLFSCILPYPFTSSMFTGMFLALLLMLFFDQKNAWTKWIGLWIIATFVASILSKGYLYYSIEFRVHRFIVTIPILLTAAIYAYGYMIEKTKPLVFAIITSVLLLGAIQYAILIQHQRPDNTHLAFIRWFSSIKGADVKSLTLLYDAHRQYDLTSLNDSMQYFYPEIEVRIDYNHTLSPKNCAIDTIPGAILIPSDHVCAFVQRGNRSLFSYEKGPELSLFQNDSATSPQLP